MKKAFWAIFFALMVAIIGYTMVSTANKHTAKDNAAMIQWRYEHAVR